MISTFKLAARNLLRYRRRTLLTALLITMGVMALLLFVAAAGSFKQTMVGSITDSMIGHLQVHRKGYTQSIDNRACAEFCVNGLLAGNCRIVRSHNEREEA